MSVKALRICRVVITGSIAIAVTIAVALGNPIITLIAVVIGMGLLYLCRKRVKGVIADERNYRISEKAARITMAIYGPVVGVLSAVLLALSNSLYPDLKPVAYTTAYLSSALVLLYYILYIYYERKS